MYRNFGKRTLDLFLTILALILLAPLFGLISLLVLINLGPPVFFLQRRPGKDGRPFTLIKFRTMKMISDGDGNVLSDAERLTSFGCFLRSTSLDELPELFNVLKGDMSLVGPRPLLMEYLDRYTPEQAQRHAVKPGITGLAQIMGRNALPWEERFKLDVDYVGHVSPGLDMRILCLTLLKTLKREGINADGHSTMPTFTGSTNNN
ncbi:MAG: sugar transferase [Pyrinomonadaceae bacterium]